MEPQVIWQGKLGNDRHPPLPQTSRQEVMDVSYPYRNYNEVPMTAEERAAYYENHAISLRMEGFEATAAELEALDREMMADEADLPRQSRS